MSLYVNIVPTIGKLLVLNWLPPLKNGFDALESRAMELIIIFYITVTNDYDIGWRAAHVSTALHPISFLQPSIRYTRFYSPPSDIVYGHLSHSDG